MSWLPRRRRPRPADFSLRDLARTNPSLAASFTWRGNRLPDVLPDPLWLHVGCGESVLDGFLNLDFLPGDPRVAEWDLLEPWPERWPRAARGAFSEDTLEHLFLGEQLYVLCEVNRALADGAVFRVLMPSLARLLAYCAGFTPRAGELLHDTYGVETEADAINVGMRFSGHRWLHDDASLAHLAALAGFAATRTTCAASAEPFLAGRNLRVEEGTASFAHDLVKHTAIARTVVEPDEVRGLVRVETVADGIELLRVVEHAAEIRFRLPRPVRIASLACVNVRSADVTQFREHSLKRVIVRGPGVEGEIALDETLKSKPAMNVLWPALVRRAAGGDERTIEEIALVPGFAGDLVTSGALEVYTRGE